MPPLDPDRLPEYLTDVCRRLGIGQYEFFSQVSRTLSASARDGAVETFVSASTRGTAVRVLQDGRMGFSYFFGAEADMAAAAVEAARTSALEAAADEHHGFTPAGAWPLVPGLFDPELDTVSLEAKKQRALDLEAAAVAFDPRVKKARQAEYREALSRVRLVNSTGLDFQNEQSVVSASVMVMAADGADQEMAWDFDFSRTYAGLDVGAVGASAARLAVDQLGGGSVPSGRYPVILVNLVATEFLEVLGPSFHLDNVLKGKSLLRDKEGQAVFAPELTVLDDGLRPAGLGSSPADDEGTPRTSRAVVDGGVVGGFLADGYWGRRAGRPSTGNANRPGLTAPPVVGPSNFFIPAGGSDPAELVRKLDRGLLVTEVMGMHTADPISGRFSVGASGQWIEGGRVVRPVKGLAIAGEVPEMFRRLIGVASDLRFTGRYGSPSLLIDGIAVSGR